MIKSKKRVAFTYNFVGKVRIISNLYFYFNSLDCTFQLTKCVFDFKIYPRKDVLHWLFIGV